MDTIAVIGAGIAGLTVTADLAALGHAVALFDKSHGPGGRCATRRSAIGDFDHGAPGFCTTTAAFRAQVSVWQHAGWVCSDIAGASVATGSVAQQATSPLYGVPSMNMLARCLAAQLPAHVTLHTDCQVAAIDPDAAVGAWRLRLSNGVTHPGRFGAVVVAVPAEQAAALLVPDAALAEKMRHTRSDPCWTVMVAWAQPLPVPLTTRINGGDCGTLSMARCDDLRTGRTAAEGVACRWVLHATPQWTVDHLEAPPETVAAKLLRAFERELGASLPAPTHAVAHRWRYAQVVTPCREPCGWNATLRLGACGDAWHAHGDLESTMPDGIERAWLSGRALSQQVHRTLSPR
jgi:renalase